MIYGFVANGGTVYEQSEVIRFEERKNGVRVHTAQGTLLARSGVVVAVHSAAHTTGTGQFDHDTSFYTYAGTTSPVAGRIQTLITYWQSSL